MKLSQLSATQPSGSRGGVQLKLKMHCHFLALDFCFSPYISYYYSAHCTSMACTRARSSALARRPSHRCFAALSSTGSIVLWDSVSFEETFTMRHEEFVTEICFNNKWNSLVSDNFKTTKIWTVSSGQLVADLPKPTDGRALAITVFENNASVFFGSDDKVLRQYSMNAKGKRLAYVRSHVVTGKNTPVEGGYRNLSVFYGF